MTRTFPNSAGELAPAYAYFAAVDAAAVGNFAAARYRLRPALTSPYWRGPTMTLLGSLWRQAGHHELAARADGHALRLAGDTEWARADALISLAADRLGVGRLAESRGLLVRADGLLGCADGPLTRMDGFVAGVDEMLPIAGRPDDLGVFWTGDRVRLRRRWVGAELELASGRPDRAIELLDPVALAPLAAPSPRHRIKTELIRSAARLTAGDVGALAAAQRVLESATELNFRPIQWACAQLLAAFVPPSISPGTIGPSEYRAKAEALARELARSGVRWRIPDLGV